MKNSEKIIIFFICYIILLCVPYSAIYVILSILSSIGIKTSILIENIVSKQYLASYFIVMLFFTIYFFKEIIDDIKQ